MSFQKCFDKKGLTAIEMVMVVAIIAILVGLAFPAYQSIRVKTRKTTCLSNMKQYGYAFLLFQSDNGYIPQSYNGALNWWQVLSNDNLVKTNQTAVGVIKIPNCPSYVKEHGEPVNPNTTYCMPIIKKDITTDLFGDSYEGPQDVFLLSEKKDAVASEGWALTSKSDLSRHETGSNYLFMDGHVGFLKPVEAQSASYCWPNTDLNDYC